MSFNFRLSYVMLAGIAAVSVFSMIGFFNANATDVNMSDTMGVNGNMTGNMTDTMSGNMTGNMTGTMSENMTGNTNTTTPTPPAPTILPPLQQIKSGTTAQSVQCVSGFSLIFKTEDGSPACVTSQDASTLVARGWGKTA